MNEPDFLPWMLFTNDMSIRWILALLHFLWQGATIGALVFLSDHALRNRSARFRYFLFSLALLAAPMCVVLTFSQIVVPNALRQPVARGDAGPFANKRALNVELGDPEFGNTKVKARLGSLPSIEATSLLTLRSDGADLTEFSNTSVSPSNAWVNVIGWFSAAYLLGVVGFSIRLGVALRGGQRMRNAALRISDMQLIQAVNLQVEKVGLRFVPVVAYCDRIAVPTVVGLVKPMILLPATILTNLSLQEVTAIIAHELVHIRRYDLWMNLAQRFIESLLFFHPAVWFISRKISQERELCCDDLVVSLGNEPLSYAGALLSMAELCVRVKKSDLATLAAGGHSQAELERRIKRLMSFGSQSPVRLTRAGFLTVLGLVLTGIATPAVLSVPARSSDSKFSEIVTRSDDDKDADRKTIKGQVAGALTEDQVSAHFVLEEQDDRKSTFKKRGNVITKPETATDQPTTAQLARDSSSVADSSLKTASLKIRFDILGIEPVTKIGVRNLSTDEYFGDTEMWPGSAKVNEVKNGETIEVSALPPGDYELSRFGETTPNGRRGLHLDFQRITLEAGEKKLVEFSRPNGKRLSGRVLNRNDFEIESLYAWIVPADAPKISGPSFMIMHGLDLKECDANGAFRTDPLVPGRYAICIEGYGKASNLGGIDVPRFIGRVEFEFPTEGEPAQVGISVRDMIHDIEWASYVKEDDAAHYVDRLRPSWGEAKRGIQFGISLGVIENKFRAGERVPAVFFLRNSSDKELGIEWSADFLEGVPKLADEFGKESAIVTERPKGKVSWFKERLKSGGVIAFKHRGIGLGPSPLPDNLNLPGNLNWVPYLEKAEAGKYSLSFTQSIRVTEGVISAEAQLEILTSGAVELALVMDDPIKNALNQLLTNPALREWKLKLIDEQPSVEADGFHGYRVTLTKAWNEFTNPPQSAAIGVDQGPFEFRSTDWEFVLIPIEPKKAPAELRSKLPWKRNARRYYTCDICLGEGLGYVWFTRATLFDQELARAGLKLQGGDDRIQLLVNGTQIKDPGTNTANSCQRLLAVFGDAALPYIRKAVDTTQNEEDLWRVVGSLGFIQTEPATELLVKYYNSKRTKSEAEYALINRPFREQAKNSYLDILQRHSSVDSACAACQEFNWKEAIPTLKAIFAQPANTRELFVVFETLRILEGHPIPKRLLESYEIVFQSSRVDPTEEGSPVGNAIKQFAHSSDHEAAIILALQMINYTNKANVDHIRSHGAAILEVQTSPPAVLFLKNVLDSLPKREREAVMQSIRVRK